jgi:TrmH family RNA methyltransferase
MGAHLRLPVYQANWEELSRIVSGMAVWLATADGEIDYVTVNWCRPSVLIIGNEARGPGHDAYQLAGGRVSIPIAANTESLNAAVAASVILFEAARQRRIKPPCPR